MYEIVTITAFLQKRKTKWIIERFTWAL